MDNISEKEILEVIQNALNIEGKRIAFDSSMRDVEEWDSLGHLSILAALDKFFYGKVAGIEEMATAGSIQEILQILKNNHLM